MVNAMWNCCRLGARSMNTTQPCTGLQCHFIRSHANILPPALMAEWPGSFLHTTAVTWGCNGYRNKSQHRQLTVGKKILPLLLPGLEPETFWSRSQVQCPSACFYACVPCACPLCMCPSARLLCMGAPMLVSYACVCPVLVHYACVPCACYDVCLMLVCYDCVPHACPLCVCPVFVHYACVACASPLCMCSPVLVHYACVPCAYPPCMCALRLSAMTVCPSTCPLCVCATVLVCYACVPRVCPMCCDGAGRNCRWSVPCFRWTRLDLQNWLSRWLMGRIRPWRAQRERKHGLHHSLAIQTLLAAEEISHLLSDFVFLLPNVVGCVFSWGVWGLGDCHC